MALLNGRVAIVTGAGRGLGRAHALALAGAGAAVVLNDVGAALSGDGGEDTPADEVAAEIVAAGGRPVSGRIVNTTSGTGMFGNVGQSAYAAAKAGIIGITLSIAMELRRYGVTVNAISPIARTRMTAGLVPDAPADGFDDSKSGGQLAADELADGTAALYGTMPAGVNTLNG